MKKIVQNTRQHTVKGLMAFSLLLIMLLIIALPAKADDDYVKPQKLYRVGKKTITVNAGTEFDLKVRTFPQNADDDYLQWKIISGSRYVGYDKDEDDRNDDDIELRAKKAGTAKIRCKIQGTKKKVLFTVKVKKASQEIKAAGLQTRNVTVYDDFELQVKKYAGLNERYLKWTIKDTSVVDFDDDDRTDDEVEFYAKKTGNTTISCTNTLTGQTVTFHITVVKRSAAHNRYDTDDYDDDHDDD